MHRPTPCTGFSHTRHVDSISTLMARPDFLQYLVYHRPSLMHNGTWKQTWSQTHGCVNPMMWSVQVINVPKYEPKSYIELWGVYLNYKSVRRSPSMLYFIECVISLYLVYWRDKLRNLKSSLFSIMKNKKYNFNV